MSEVNESEVPVSVEAGAEGYRNVTLEWLRKNRNHPSLFGCPIKFTLKNNTECAGYFENVTGFARPDIVSISSDPEGNNTSRYKANNIIATSVQIKLPKA